MKIGVLGGTFDPVHYGHLILAQEAFEQLRLDKVVFMLSATPPHKKHKTILEWNARLTMLKLALDSDNRFEVSGLENELEKPSYTIKTVRYLYSTLPSCSKLYWIIGSDMLLDIESWHEYNKLIEEVNFAVAERPSFDLSKVKCEYLSKVFTIQMPQIDISSREIQKRVRKGRSIRYMTTEKVVAYIKKYRLYL